MWAASKSAGPILHSSTCELVCLRRSIVLSMYPMRPSPRPVPVQTASKGASNGNADEGYQADDSSDGRSQHEAAAGPTHQRASGASPLLKLFMHCRSC